MIDNFDGKFAFLSNFYESSVTWEGITYPTTEHAFQAAKSLNPKVRLEFLECATPGQAKRKGRKVSLRSDWEEVKCDIMEEIVYAKFLQHPDLAEKLLATGTEELVEGNNWGDTCWGVCNGVGNNYLGKILMYVRAKLRLSQDLENDINSPL